MLNSTVSPTYDLQGRSNSPKLSKSQYKGKSHNLWKSLSCAARILTQPFAIQEFEMYKYINSVLIFSLSKCPIFYATFYEYSCNISLFIIDRENLILLNEFHPIFAQ